jgi:hypothetical protein
MNTSYSQVLLQLPTDEAHLGLCVLCPKTQNSQLLIKLVGKLQLLQPWQICSSPGSFLMEHMCVSVGPLGRTSFVVPMTTSAAGKGVGHKRTHDHYALQMSSMVPSCFHPILSVLNSLHLFTRFSL